MNEKEYVVILSDIHMGTKSPLVWYRKDEDEKYLIAIFNDIIRSASQISELILLGNIFEFWTYAPNEVPPTIEDIIAVHPKILGPKGKLRQVLSALMGRVIFIPGDHDMIITQTELDQLRSIEGYTIKYHLGAYLPDYDAHTLFTHGHEYTLLNSSYYKSQLTPLPVGYFISRAIAYQSQKVIARNPGLTSSDLPDYMEHEYNKILQMIKKDIMEGKNSANFIELLVDAIVYSTGITVDLPIHINKTTVVSLNDVKKIYKDFPQNFYDNLMSLGISTHQLVINSKVDELNQNFLLSYLKENVLGSNIDLVVMGNVHSHVMPFGNYQYDVTSDFLCPSFLKRSQKPLSYRVYNNQSRAISVMNVPLDSRVQISFDTMKQDNSLDSRSDISKVVSAQIDQTEDLVNNMTFGWSVYNASLEFYMQMQMGILSKAEEFGIEILQHDEKGNTIEMLTGSMELLNQGINALLIAPFNPELLPAIVAEATVKQIPVIAIDIGTGGAEVAAFIVSDSFGGGIYAGEYALYLIKKYAIKSRNAAIITVQETSKYALLRGQGFKGVMLQNGYNVVAQISAYSEEIISYQVTMNILSIYKDDLAVIFCENGPMTLGAARAIGEVGKKGQVMLLGFDSEQSVLDGIKNGSIQGTIAQDPYKMGEIGVEVARSILLEEPIVYDVTEDRIILMEVYLIDEQGEVRRSIGS